MLWDFDKKYQRKILNLMQKKKINLMRAEGIVVMEAIKKLKEK